MQQQERRRHTGLLLYVICKDVQIAVIVLAFYTILHNIASTLKGFLSVLGRYLCQYFCCRARHQGICFFIFPKFSFNNDVEILLIFDYPRDWGFNWLMLSSFDVLVMLVSWFFFEVIVTTVSFTINFGSHKIYLSCPTQQSARVPPYCASLPNSTSWSHTHPCSKLFHTSQF